MICTIARTGSTLLSRSLQATELAGKPREYFNPSEQEKPWLRAILGDRSVFTGLPQILAAGSTPNGVFGANAHWLSFQYLGMSVAGRWAAGHRTIIDDLLNSPCSAISDIRLDREFRQHFPTIEPMSTALELLRSHMRDLRFIWLTRKNMVARAISHFRARRSGEWNRSAVISVRAGRRVDFDFNEIHILNKYGAYQQAQWAQFFASHCIRTYDISYEQLAGDYELTFRRVLDFLEIEQKGVAVPLPRLVKQADELSQEWEDRYRQSYEVVL